METNWCIKLDAENRDVVIEYLEKKYDCKIDGEYTFYGVYNDVFRFGKIKWQKELDVEQFISKIRNEDYNVDFNIITEKYLLVRTGNESTSKNNPPIFDNNSSKFLSELDNDTKNVFDKTLSSLADLLKYKNAKYGNSVLDPLEIFKGKCKAGDRIDDKLSRIKTSKELRKNDVSDLIGYLVLTCVENNWDNFDEFKD